MNETKIVELIRSGRHEKAFKKLYQLFPQFQKHILANSGSKEEALDIFQEALLVFYRRVNQGNLASDFSCEGYVITTGKLLWNNELRKKKVRTGDDKALGQLVHEDEIQSHLEKENKLKHIEKVLRKLGGKCRSILEQFYFRSMSMESIAKKFGFKTVDAAKVQKYRCLETARKMALEAQLSNTKTTEL